MNFPTGKYQIIYADPAWKYDDKAKAGNRGAESKYDVMELDEICKLPVRDIADEDCVLFLWGTWPNCLQPCGLSMNGDLSIKQLDLSGRS